MRTASKHLLRIAATAYAVALAAVSLVPSGSGAMARWDSAISPGVQNLLHLPAYALLAALAVLSLAGSGRLPPAAVLWIAAGCCAFGIVLECAQSAIPGRTGSVADALANVVGISVGAPIAARIRRRRACGRRRGRAVEALGHCGRGRER